MFVNPPVFTVISLTWPENKNTSNSQCCLTDLHVYTWSLTQVHRPQPPTIWWAWCVAIMNSWHDVLIRNNCIFSGQPVEFPSHMGLWSWGFCVYPAHWLVWLKSLLCFSSGEIFYDWNVAPLNPSVFSLHLLCFSFSNKQMIETLSERWSEATEVSSGL